MDYSQLDDNPWISDEENMRILALVPQTAPESIYTRRVAAFYLSMNHTARMLFIAFRERPNPLLQLNTQVYKLLRSMFTFPFFSVNSSMFRTWEALPRILSRLEKWILHLTIALTLGLSIAQASNHQDSNGKPFFSQPVLVIWLISAIYTAYMGCRLLPGFAQCLTTFTAMAAGGTYQLAFAQDPSNMNSVAVLGTTLGMGLNYFWCGLGWSAPETPF